MVIGRILFAVGWRLGYLLVMQIEKTSDAMQIETESRRVVYSDGKMRWRGAQCQDEPRWWRIRLWVGDRHVTTQVNLAGAHELVRFFTLLAEDLEQGDE